MKKILITIILILFCNNNVHAATETYYSNYSDFSPYSNSIIEGNDLVDVKKITMYRYYKEEKSYGDYYMINESNPLYPYVDTSDFKATDYTNWSETIPANKVGRVIQKRDVYYYWEMKKIRYIHFTELWGSRNQLNINEIIISANNQEIPYTISCNGCSNNFFEKITNGNFNSEGSYVLHGGYLTIDLNGYYNLSDLNIRFFITDLDNDEKRYTISTSRGESLNSDIYNSNLTRLFFKHNNVNEYIMREYKLDKLNLVNPEWDNVKKSYNPIDKTTTRQVEKKIEYSYQDTLYRHYNFKKIYIDGYYESSPIGFPIKDETDNIEYFKSRSRDKVIIQDKIIINNKNQKLEDFVVENTTNSLEFSGNINYEENGMYEVSYIFPFITISKIVHVNIFENEVIPIEEPDSEDIRKPDDRDVEKPNSEEEIKRKKNGMINSKENKNKDVPIITVNEPKTATVDIKLDDNKSLLPGKDEISINKNKINEVKNIMSEINEKKGSTRKYITFPVILLALLSLFCYCKYKKLNKKSE